MRQHDHTQREERKMTLKYAHQPRPCEHLGWTVNVLTWAGDHYDRYGHEAFSSKAEAQAFIEEKRKADLLADDSKETDRRVICG
jgi:hypothetical protein